MNYLINIEELEEFLAIWSKNIYIFYQQTDVLQCYSVLDFCQEVL